MNNLAVKLILIGAGIGLVLGIAGNLLGRGALDYNADYNPGYRIDESKINKDLDENFKAEWPRTNTVIGGSVFGLIAGALIGLVAALTSSGNFYVLSMLIGFFAAPFIASPMPFYGNGMVPPVAFAYRLAVFLPGMVLAVLLHIFLERYKPAPAEPAEEALPSPEANSAAQGKEKPKGNQWHQQKKKH